MSFRTKRLIVVLISRQPDVVMRSSERIKRQSKICNYSLNIWVEYVYIFKIGLMESLPASVLRSQYQSGLDGNQKKQRNIYSG